MNHIIQERLNKDDSISLKENNIIPISTNVVTFNPTIMLIKELINKNSINEALNIIGVDAQYNQNIYIHQNQDPDKNSTLFTSQNAYVPFNNILTIDNPQIDLLKREILAGVKEIMNIYYKSAQQFKVSITNSWMQKYKSGTFLSPHNHLTSNMNNKSIYLSMWYYIDDGDPDLTQSYSGCITFINEEKLYHIRPKPGMLLMWKSNLIHLVNPFYSKSNKDRFMLSANLEIEVLES